MSVYVAVGCEHQSTSRIERGELRFWAVSGEQYPEIDHKQPAKAADWIGNVQKLLKYAPSF